MFKSSRALYLAPVCLALFSSFANAALVTSFEDIDFWVGSGSNRAALVIDWKGTGPSQQSWAWGYRWEGAATGADMFLSVVSSDPRLFAKVSSPGSLGISLYGIGYDDGDGDFSIDDGTVFGSDGIAVDPASRDGANPIDPGDLYEEGWLSEGYWAYYLSEGGSPFAGGSWLAAESGISGESLNDGDWNGLTFAAEFAASEPSAAFAAVPEPSGLVWALPGMLFFARRRRTRNNVSCS